MYSWAEYLVGYLRDPYWGLANQSASSRPIPNFVSNVGHSKVRDARTPVRIARTITEFRRPSPLGIPDAPSNCRPAMHYLSRLRPLLLRDKSSADRRR